MPLFHCKECHHEWEGGGTVCDWCGAKGKIIQKETQFEKFCRTVDLTRIEDYMKDIKKYFVKEQDANRKTNI